MKRESEWRRMISNHYIIYLDKNPLIKTQKNITISPDWVEKIHMYEYDDRL